MQPRVFPFEGPPYLGRGVRVFIAVAMGPLLGLITGTIAFLVLRLVTGAESTEAMLAGGAAGWLGLSVLLLAREPRTTPGTVSVGDETLVRTWRVLRQEVALAELARCELHPGKWIVLGEQGGKVVVLEAPGVDLPSIVEEIHARLRRHPRGNQARARIAPERKLFDSR